VSVFSRSGLARGETQDHASPAARRRRGHRSAGLLVIHRKGQLLRAGHGQVSMGDIESDDFDRGRDGRQTPVACLGRSRPGLLPWSGREGAGPPGQERATSARLGASP
jgi:hypothetical protein